MSWLASVILAVLHALYRLVLVFQSVFRSDKEPRPIAAQRSKLPSHLAVTLVPNAEVDDDANEQYMLNTVEKVVSWCKVAGIRRLTVYDRQGVLAKCSLELRQRLHPPPSAELDDSPVECDIQYPPTPPPSDDAESRPLSPHSDSAMPKLSVTTIHFPVNPSKARKRMNGLKRRRVLIADGKTDEPQLILDIISYQSGKPAVAAAAGTFLHAARQRKLHDDVAHAPPPIPSIQELNVVLEGEHGFPSPDLMIVHRKPPVAQLREPVELDGFPPWQTRLTEIYWDRHPPVERRWWRWATPEDRSSIEETEFRRALDEFADAEMRLGK
ncbi:hypothetical protein BV20DRAFT_933788 [Pilatotrama ljubarskyi]|nr:hypothetical protein BV20DRAFT_933788 [Pilatotrama ljubarskyi]